MSYLLLSRAGLWDVLSVRQQSGYSFLVCKSHLPNIILHNFLPNWNIHFSNLISLQYLIPILIQRLYFNQVFDRCVPAQLPSIFASKQSRLRYSCKGIRDWKYYLCIKLPLDSSFEHSLENDICASESSIEFIISLIIFILIQVRYSFDTCCNL